MKILASIVGLLGAMSVAPLALQAQQFIPASAGMSYGGPSHYESNEYMAAPCHSAPYGYLWNGYCEQKARHYACRMHHAMNAAAVASQAAGACPSEKFHIMKDSIGSRINIFGPCGHCPNCRDSKSKGCSACTGAYDYEDTDEDDSAVPPLPDAPDSADSQTVRPVQETPVLLTPVESPEQGVDNPATPRSPVVRLAPAAPQAPSAGSTQSQPERTERRIPRNVVPPRPANPRSAAIPVTTNLSNGSFSRR